MSLAVEAIIGAIVSYFYLLNVLAWICVIPMVIHFFILNLIEYENTRKTTFNHFDEAIKKIKNNKKLQKISLLQIFDRYSSYPSHSNVINIIYFRI